MIQSRDILLGILLPGAIAFVIALLGRLSGRDAPARPVAIGGGFFVGYFMLFRPKFPPPDAIDWLCFIAAGLVAIGLLQLLAIRAAGAWGWLASAGIVLAVSVASTFLIARPLLQHTWQPPAGYCWIAGIALATVSIWTAVEFLSHRLAPAALLVALTLIIAAAAITTTLSSSQALGQAGGILAATTGGLAIAAILRRRQVVAPGAYLAPLVLFVGILACASTHFYAEMAPANSILLLLSPAAMLPAALPVVCRLRPIRQGLIAIVLSLIPAGVAVALAAAEFARASSESAGAGW